MIHNLYLAGLLKKNLKYKFTSTAREIVLNRYLQRKETSNSYIMLAHAMIEQIPLCTTQSQFETKIRRILHIIDKARLTVLNDIEGLKRISHEEKTGLSSSQETKINSMKKLLKLLQSKGLLSS